MTYQLLGISLVILGSLHLLPAVYKVDSHLIRAVQTIFNRKAILFIFREIWFLGRTSFTMITLGFLILANWKAGLAALGVFLIIVGIEQLIKKTFKRTRPYLAENGIQMLQPLEPFDPSYPSGDALRVWFLAILIPIITGSSPIILLAAIGLALAVTLGRMVMGVHYLTDTIAGTGLGLLGAGITIWVWSQLNIFF